MSLPEALERAAAALERDADAIRPANGDPEQLLGLLEPDAASRVLGWMLDHEVGAAEELVGHWADDPRGRPLLADLDEASLSKPGRKVLRRVRHRLRSSGVELAEPEKREPVVARLPSLGDELELAFVSALDPGGGQLAYLVESQPSGGVRLFELVLDPARGIVRFEIYSASRSKARRFLKELQRQSRLAACEVEPPALRALVARVADAQPADRPLPQGFAEWRSHLSRESGEATPGELAHAVLGDEGEPSELRRVADWVRGGSLGPWPPPRALLSALADRIAESSDSPLVLSGPQRAARLEGWIDEAVGEAFGEERAAQCAERLRESAYVLWKLDRADDARACLAAARAFREQPPAENPVAKAMLEVALAPELSARAERAAPREEGAVDEPAEAGEEPGLIVEP